MTTHCEPKAIRELRKIRDEIHREVMAVGFDRYYEELKKKTGWLLSTVKKPRSAIIVREKSAKYGKAKREGSSP